MTLKVHKAAYPRERKRSSITSVAGILFDRLTDTSTGAQTIISNSSELREFQNWEVMSDIVTPGFAAIQARGGFVNTPMSRSTVLYEQGGSGSEALFVDGIWKEEYRHSNGTLFMLFGVPTISPMTINLQNLISYTKTNALSKARSSSMMGLVTLAEMRKTINMLKHPLDSMSSLLQYIEQNQLGKQNMRVAKKNGEILSINGRDARYRGKKYRGPGKVVRSPKHNITVPTGEAISGSVLANNLGLRPMLMDIDAILHAIPNAHQEDRLTFRSKATEEQTTVVTSSPLNVGGMYTTAKTTTSHQVVVRSNVMIKDKFSVSEDFGVSLADLPEAAWELIPYSFVLDYVVNVGDYLGALRALATQEILTASTVYEITSIATREPISTVPAAHWSVVSAPTGKDIMTQITKVRVPGTGIPDGLAVLPQSAMLTPSHIQNSLSLIVQQLTRIQKRSGRSTTPFY